MSKRQKGFLLILAGVLLLAAVLLAYMYTSPWIVPDEPIAEFPVCLQQATEVELWYDNGGAWPMERLNNRFARQAFIRDVVAALGEPVDHTPLDVDGGYSLDMVFYRGEERICVLTWVCQGEPNHNEERLYVWDGESQGQWYVWTGASLIKPYIEDLQIEAAAHIYDVINQYDRNNIPYVSPYK